MPNNSETTVSLPTPEQTLAATLDRAVQALGAAADPVALADHVLTHDLTAIIGHQALLAGLLRQVLVQIIREWEGRARAAA